MIWTHGSKHDRLTHRQAALLEMTLKLLRSAFAAEERFRLSCRDAAIIEAARELGCHMILSEDLNHGRDHDGVRVVNPFRKTRSRR